MQGTPVNKWNLTCSQATANSDVCWAFFGTNGSNALVINIIGVEMLYQGRIKDFKIQFFSPWIRFCGFQLFQWCCFLGLIGTWWLKKGIHMPLRFFKQSKMDNPKCPETDLFKHVFLPLRGGVSPVPCSNMFFRGEIVFSYLFCTICVRHAEVVLTNTLFTFFLHKKNVVFALDFFPPGLCNLSSKTFGQKTCHN